MGCFLVILILLILHFTGVSKIAVIILGFAFCFIGMPLLFWERTEFRRKAKKVEAVLVDYETRISIDNNYTYYPIFEYTVSEHGIVRSDIESSRAELYTEPDKGKKMMIYYNPENPQEIHLPHVPRDIIFSIGYIFAILYLTWYTYFGVKFLWFD